MSEIDRINELPKSQPRVDFRYATDYGTAAWPRHTDVNAEVLAIQHYRRLEAGNLAVAHARIDAVNSRSRLTGLVTPGLPGSLIIGLGSGFIPLDLNAR